jgi:hypothetical protein
MKAPDRRAGIGLVLTAVVVSLAVGCSPSSRATDAVKPTPPEPTVSEIPGVTTIPHLSDTRDLTLPVDAYLPSAYDLLQTTKAMTTLEQRCVSRFGLRYVPAAERAPGSTMNSRRYGVPESVETAREFGFHMTQNDPRSVPADSGAAPSREVLQVLTGYSGTSPLTSYHGMRVPKGGCVGDADRTVTGTSDRSAGHSPVAEKIRSDSFEYSMLDPRVIAAQDTWRKCMADRGYTNYKTALDAGGDKSWDTPAATSQEITVAVADWQCAKRANVVGIWSAVESAYQNAQIDKHAEELKQAQDALRDQAKRVALLLAGGSPSGT